MKVVVDESKCVGHGLCEAAVPRVFEINDDGFVTVHPEAVRDADPDLVRQAVRACPSGALTVTE
ncbi:MAG TPA: ferredoxin [Mycobacterium sp.]|nr:ferredoxin [Mycobacterium sp.]